LYSTCTVRKIEHEAENLGLRRHGAERSEGPTDPVRTKYPRSSVHFQPHLRALCSTRGFPRVPARGILYQSVIQRFRGSWSWNSLTLYLRAKTPTMAIAVRTFMARSHQVETCADIPQAIGQLCSTASMTKNLALCQVLVKRAVEAGAKVHLLFLTVSSLS
jgi:hypothetical protein